MSDNIDLTDPMEVDLLLNKSLACENEFELISDMPSFFQEIHHFLQFNSYAMWESLTLIDESMPFLINSLEVCGSE